MSAKIRKLLVQVDETRIEMGQTIDPPTRRAVARISKPSTIDLLAAAPT